MKHLPYPKHFLSLTGLFSLLAHLRAIAQMQPDIPQPRGPVDLSDTSNLVIFIILPAIVIVLIFFWRRAVKKRRAEREQEE